MDRLGFKYSEPEGAFYLWVDIKEFLNKKYQSHLLVSSIDFSDKLLADTRVVAVAGDYFGAKGYLRLSIATEESKVMEALSRIKVFTTKLENK